MPANPLTAIALAIAEVSKVIGKHMATARVRHLKAAVDAAERYIFVNEGMGENEKLTLEQKSRLLAKFRRRFFKYN